MHLVLDWDGTVTERDTLHMTIERYGDLAVFRDMEERLGRELTLNEVIGIEMSTISAPLDEVVAWLLETVTVRAGFAELVAAHDPLIVSAGFTELIDPILEREGIKANVIANHLLPDPAGWQAVFLERESCPVCGEPCKRMALARGGPFAYVGDGISDRCVSLVADRVFARDGLAVWLAAQDVPFEAYGDLHDVRRALVPVTVALPEVGPD